MNEERRKLVPAGRLKQFKFLETRSNTHFAESAFFWSGVRVCVCVFWSCRFFRTQTRKV